MHWLWCIVGWSWKVETRNCFFKRVEVVLVYFWRKYLGLRPSVFFYSSSPLCTVDRPMVPSALYSFGAISFDSPWPIGCFISDTLQKKKRCNTSTHPSRMYRNQIWKNFFPKTSLEGLATWSKKVTQGSLFVAKTYFLIIVQPLWIPSGVPRRGCSIFFCPNTLPFFATDTYKLVAQGSLFIWVYSDYLSFSI